MNTSDLLEQLLKSGLSGQGGGGRQSTSGMGGLGARWVGRWAVYWVAAARTLEHPAAWVV